MTNSLDTWYRRYNELCDQHRFGELADHVHAEVRVNADNLGVMEQIGG